MQSRFMLRVEGIKRPRLVTVQVWNAIEDSFELERWGSN